MVGRKPNGVGSETEVSRGILTLSMSASNSCVSKQSNQPKRPNQLSRASGSSKPSIVWEQVDTVLLDMDGTLLDLAYDNWFWQQEIPARYAQRHELSLVDAQAQLNPLFKQAEGSLNWYCLDYWSETLALDVVALKAAGRERIGLRPSCMAFLQALNRSGRSPWMATNAHRAVLDIKLATTGIADQFAKIISSHDYGYPKEQPEFWNALQAAHRFEPARSLFVDDSLAVLRAARDWGIGQVVGIREPDSSSAARASDEFILLGDFADHLPTTS